MNRAERDLRQLAAAAGYPSLRALCLAARIDRLTIRLALRGDRLPRCGTVARIAQTLSVDTKIIDRILRTAREARP